MMVGGLPPKSQTFRRKSDKDRGKDSTFDILFARLSSESPRVAGQNPLPYQSSHSPFGTQSSMLMNPLTRSTTSMNGSLDTLMSTMSSERRAAERQPKLSPQACEALRIAYACMAERKGIIMTPVLLEAWSSYRKASTVNQYAQNFRLWTQYCLQEGIEPLPVSEGQLAAWLAAMALSDKTASPTDNRCAAILYFHRIAGGVTPDDMEIVRMTKESIRRKLGYKNQSKKPLLQEQVDEVVGQFLSQPTIQGLANAFRVALAYEATLRWDDYEDMTFGDFIVTHDFVRVFLVDTKTDSTRSGQWATFAASTRSKSAYQLYRSLLSKLSSELSPEQIAQWPVMFRGEQGSLTGNESKMRYQEFLKNLKEVCRLLGYDEDMLGTHSLRRGSVTDQFRFGIPDQVIKTSGRWKSAAFQRYIDQETILSFHLRAIQTMEAAREKI